MMAFGPIPLNSSCSACVYRARRYCLREYFNWTTTFAVTYGRMLLSFPPSRARSQFQSFDYIPDSECMCCACMCVVSARIGRLSRCFIAVNGSENGERREHEINKSTIESRWLEYDSRLLSRTNEKMSRRTDGRTDGRTNRTHSAPIWT